MNVASVLNDVDTREAESAVSRILTEDVMTIDEARGELHQLSGYRPDKSTMMRWIHRGIGGIKLEAVRLGGRKWVTSTQALNRFMILRTSQKS